MADQGFGKFNLTKRDIEILVAAIECFEGDIKIDSGKLNEKLGMKNKNVANTVWCAVKRKMGVGVGGAKVARTDVGKITKPKAGKNKGKGKGEEADVIDAEAVKAEDFDEATISTKPAKKAQAAPEVKEEDQ